MFAPNPPTSFASVYPSLDFLRLPGCPVPYVQPWAAEMARAFQSHRNGYPYFPGTRSEWPHWYVQAMGICAEEYTDGEAKT